MKSTRTTITIKSIAALALSLTACASPESDPAIGGGTPPPAASTPQSPSPGASGGSGSAADEPPFPGLDVKDLIGNVRLYLTDAPGDFQAVWVSITSVEVHRAAGNSPDGGAEAASDDAGGGSWIALTSEKKRLDLLTLKDEASAILGDATLSPGRYNQLRMLVDGGEVVVDGVTHPLIVPGGAQSGIKMNLDFEVGTDGGYTLVIDFDAEQSVRQAGDKYLLSPVLAVEFVGRVKADGNVATVYRRPKNPGSQGAEHRPGDGGAEERGQGSQGTRPDGGAPADHRPDGSAASDHRPDAGHPSQGSDDGARADGGRAGEPMNGEPSRPDAASGRTMPRTGRP